MAISPLETRGSIFDPNHANGILVGYELHSDRTQPVVDIIRKKPDGTILRTRYLLQVVIEALSKIPSHE